MLKLGTTLTAVLLLLFNAGCSIDTSALAFPCGDPADFEGCFARVPEVVSPDDPEIYLHVNSEDECRISGYGSLGSFSHFVFTARPHATEETRRLKLVTDVSAGDLSFDDWLDSVEEQGSLEDVLGNYYRAPYSCRIE